MIFSAFAPFTYKASLLISRVFHSVCFCFVIVSFFISCFIFMSAFQLQGPIHRSVILKDYLMGSFPWQTFSPPEAIIDELSLVEQKQFPFLKGVIALNETSVAVFNMGNDTVVGVDDEIDDAVVQSITSSGVNILSHQQDLLRLTLSHS